MHTDRCGNAHRQKCCAKGSGKEVKIQRMWNLKCTIITVIIGATGIVTRSLRKNLEAVPGKYLIYSLWKTAILGTSHIIRKVLQCEAWSLSGGDHRWFKRSTRKKCLWQEKYIFYNNNNNNNNKMPFINFCYRRLDQAVILVISTLMYLFSAWQDVTV